MVRTLNEKNLKCLNKCRASTFNLSKIFSMKNTTNLLISLLLSFTVFSQEEISLNSNAESKSVLVKIKNSSFKNYCLILPSGQKIQSVTFGSTSFCMVNGQELFVELEDKIHLLLTANSTDKNSYNLRRLVKKRKKELGLN